MDLSHQYVEVSALHFRNSAAYILLITFIKTFVVRIWFVCKVEATEFFAL